MMKRSSVEYDLLAPFYDDFFGEPPQNVELIDRWIRQNNPDTQAVLELACGTGSVLRRLKYPELIGLDDSPNMLAIAKQKVPDATFIEADMTQFRLGQNVDVALCVFDSINHLTDFKLWQELFQNTAAHLNEGGLFIFDMVTNSMVQRELRRRKTSQIIRDKKLQIAGAVDDQGIVHWDVAIYQGPEAQDPACRVEICEKTFPHDQVQQALKPHFQTLDVYNPYWRLRNRSPDRLYYICQKN